MEQEVKCKSLIASYKNDKENLEVHHKVNFELKMKEVYHVNIEQKTIRKIIISSDEDVSAMNLYFLLSQIEKLLMLFDGAFLHLSEIKLYNSDSSDEEVLNSCGEKMIEKRLTYYTSADFCNYDIEKILEFDSVINADLFYNWKNLLEELDIVHQMYLYSLSDSGITVDIKCAFLIELAEPLVEIVKKHTNFFASIVPGKNRGISLKNCLDVLITKYGVDIFKRELSSDYDKFLSTLVNSRVRIMHIKREQKGVCFNGKESILYALKMSLLYRKIMFELLGIHEDCYSEKLKEYVLKLNEWNNVLNGFLEKLSK